MAKTKSTVPTRNQLRCPYTGASQKAVYDDDLGARNGWYLAGGANISLPFLDPEAASRYPVCLHTGAELKPVRKANLYYLPGAYDTATRYQTKEECLYYGSLRKGKTKRVLPPRPKIETKELEQISDPFEDVKANESTLKSAIAGRIDEAFHEPKPTIVVSGRK